MNIDNNGKCRNYKEGDEKNILRLFGKVFGQTMSLRFWKWRFIENPFGRGIIKLLFDNKKLIGHYAVIPMKIQAGNKPVKSVFSMTTMTHPDYRGRGIFGYLASEVYKECGKRGFKLVYGFPNKNSCPGFVKNLKWKDFGRMTILYKELKENRKRFVVIKNIYEVRRFSREADFLWDKVKKYFRVIAPRTKNYLNWRFVKNPAVKYKIYAFKDKKDLLGYVVLKIYKKKSEATGHIVDILSVKNTIVIKNLLEISYDYFLENKVKKISCWMPKSSLYGDIIKKEGFIRKYPDAETYFGIKIFNKEKNHQKNIESFNNWHLTMADSDVF